MPNYIVFDPSSTPVANRVIEYRRSFAGGRVAELGPNILTDPAMPEGEPITNLKVDGGIVVVLTQADLDAIAAADATAASQRAADYIANTKAQAKVLLDEVHTQGRMLRAFAEVVVDEINTLRTEHALPDRTLVQLRNAIDGKIDAQ